MTLVFQMNGTNPEGVSDLTNAPPGTLPCSQAQADQFAAAGGAKFPATDVFQFTFIGDVLTPLVDTRPTATWGHTPGPGVLVNGDWEFNLNVDDAEPTVTVTLSVPLTDPKKVVRLLPSGHLLSFNVVSGVASVAIETAEPADYKIRSTKEVRFTNELRVVINAAKLYGIK